MYLVISNDSHSNGGCIVHFLFSFDTNNNARDSTNNVSYFFINASFLEPLNTTFKKYTSYTIKQSVVFREPVKETIHIW